MDQVGLTQPITVFRLSNEHIERKWATLPSVSVETTHVLPSEWHLRFEHGKLILTASHNGVFSLNPQDVLRRATDRKHSPIARACGVRRGLCVLDALAGWGTDALTLSLFGCRVTTVEVNSLVHLMLVDFAEQLQCDIASFNSDALKYLNTTSDRYDVVYLDNMFPQRRKSALPSRRMQVLAELTTQSDLKAVFEAATEVSKERVVVKLRKNEKSVLPKPDWTIQAKTVRFDVYSSSNLSLKRSL